MRSFSLVPASHDSRTRLSLKSVRDQDFGKKRGKTGGLKVPTNQSTGLPYA